MHLYELTQTQAQYLINSGIGDIRPSVFLNARMKGIAPPSGGALPTFVTNRSVKRFEVTQGVLNQFIQVESKINQFPASKTNQGGNVRLQLANPDGYIASLQDGSAILLDEIEDNRLEVLVTLGTETLSLYEGTQVSRPSEENGKTTFSFRPGTWDIIDEPVRLEDTIALSAANPSISIQNGNVVSNPSIISEIEFHNGILVWNASGEVETNVENSDSSKVLLRNIDFRPDDLGQTPLLGKYTIEFTSATEFKLSQPDLQTFTGNINTAFSKGYIEILPTFWTVLSDPTGVKIEFNTYYTVKGNPITIVKNMIYKGLSGNWGQALVEDTALQVDWDTFNAFEGIYSSFTVYISETNENNDVFSPSSSSKPLRVRDFAQKILDHIGAQLVFDLQGRISMNSSFYLKDNEKIFGYDTSQVLKPGHKITGQGSQYDFVRLKYGIDTNTGNFAGVNIQTTEPKIKYKATLELEYPYFKVGIQDHVMRVIGKKIFDLARYSDITLEFDLAPNWGLPVQAGDKFKVSFNTRPILPNSELGLGTFWEAYEVRKQIGRRTSIKARMLPDSINEPPILPGMI